MGYHHHHPTTLSDTILVSNFTPAGIAISGLLSACGGNTTLLTATGGLSDYQWSNAATTLSVNADAGVWWVTATDANGCQNADTVTVVQTPLPFVAITGPLGVCIGNTATLTATPWLASYTWSQGGNQSTITAGAGSYSVLVSDSLGCTATAQFFLAPILTTAAIEVSPNPVYGTGLPVQFQSTFTAASDTLPLLLWQWNFGDGNSSTLENPAHSFYSEGTYQARLTVTDAPGCTSNAAIAVEVIGNIAIPSVITPNGDNQNDIFWIQNLDRYPPAALTIYNRWGREAYQSQAYENKWAPNEPVDGVYFYILRLHDGRTFTGNRTSLDAGR